MNIVNLISHGNIKYKYNGLVYIFNNEEKCSANKLNTFKPSCAVLLFKNMILGKMFNLLFAALIYFQNCFGLLTKDNYVLDMTSI